jgi:LysM repeat protein
MIKLLIFFSLSFSNHPIDSIGTETVNGKLFVIHKVDEKETLFAISRRYRTTVDEIIQYNKGAADGLEIGEILKVPYTPKVTLKTGDGIVHEVVAKETMFSISRKYDVSPDEIRQWNSLADNNLSIGQKLIIRKKGSATTNPLTQSNKSPEVISKSGVHTVAEKETMYSITKKYGISPEQLKKWNNLDGNELKIGQILYVSQPKQNIAIVRNADSVKTTKNTPTVSTNTTPIQTHNTTSIPPSNPPVEPKKEPVSTTITTSESTPTPQTIRISESVKNGSETIEAGLAELIEGTEGNRKYLALHRTAPIGTILKVRNEMNNREVFVRVMGKLPDTALTNKLIIRVSKSAYDRLGAIDQRFRVEVTYYK